MYTCSERERERERERIINTHAGLSILRMFNPSFTQHILPPVQKEKRKKKKSKTIKIDEHQSKPTVLIFQKLDFVVYLPIKCNFSVHARVPIKQ